jgi:hypothetical protein
MPAFPSSHRRLALGGAIAALVLGAGGAALGLHAGSAPTAAASPTTSPPPTASGRPAAPLPAHTAAHRSVVARLVAATATALTVSNPSGTQTTYTVTTRTRAIGPGHATESLSSIPAGEVVVVVSTGGPHGGRLRAGGQRATSQPPGTAVIRPLTALSVEDTGFAAR